MQIAVDHRVRQFHDAVSFLKQPKNLRLLRGAAFAPPPIKFQVKASHPLAPSTPSMRCGYASAPNSPHTDGYLANHGLLKPNERLDVKGAAVCGLPNAA